MTRRLLVVDTPAEWDQCQAPSGLEWDPFCGRGWADQQAHGPAGHPFTAPRALTAEDAYRALLYVTGQKPAALGGEALLAALTEAPDAT